MSLYEFIKHSYPYLLLINIPMLIMIFPKTAARLLPKWLCNTHSITAHFVMVLLILSGLSGLGNHTGLCLLLISFSVLVSAFSIIKASIRTKAAKNAAKENTGSIHGVIGPHHQDDFFKQVK